MKFVRFVVRSFPLIFAGVALGLAARFIFGPPEDEATMHRNFDPPEIQDGIEWDPVSEIEERPIIGNDF